MQIVVFVELYFFNEARFNRLPKSSSPLKKLCYYT